MGTPLQAFDEAGKLVWEWELDIYGAVRRGKGNKGFMPFTYQGQCEDAETGLAYNRFRYYDSESGNYISQDPIGLEGGNPILYGYVRGPNKLTDVLGLNPIIVIGEGQVRVNSVAYQLKRDGLEVRAITDDWAREFKTYDPYIKELHEPQSIEYNRKWIRERMAEGYDIYDIGCIDGNSSFYAPELDEISGAKYEQHYGYNSKT